MILGLTMDRKAAAGDAGGDRRRECLPVSRPYAHALAPTRKEPPFVAAQAGVLLLFVTIGVFATRRFRAAEAQAA